jgi:LssY C-terminus
MYGALAYLALPEYWTVHDRHLTDQVDTFLTTTPQGIPGDPINVGLVGTKEEMLRAFNMAGWHAADELTWRSSVDIGLSVVFDRPYAAAPVSTLMYEGRRQDLAFEKPVGDSADSRHHVRFWLTSKKADDGRPLWLGDAAFDRGVGFSHDTGQITHHIAPDVDAERDYLIAALLEAGALISTETEEGRGATRDGRNGGGDPYFTDGLIKIGILVPSGNVIAP